MSPCLYHSCETGVYCYVTCYLSLAEKQTAKTMQLIQADQSYTCLVLQAWSMAACLSKKTVEQALRSLVELGFESYSSSVPSGRWMPK